MITKEEIQKLAGLARMELSDTEAEHLTHEVDSILNYVGKVTSIEGDLTMTLPKLHNIMREDVAQNKANEYTENILKNAPSREGNYLKVKKILGNSDDII